MGPAWEDRQAWAHVRMRQAVQREEGQEESEDEQEDPAHANVDAGLRDRNAARWKIVGLRERPRPPGNHARFPVPTPAPPTTPAPDSSAL